MLPHLNLDMGKKTWENRETYKPKITIVTALFDGRQTSVPHSVGMYNTAYVEKLYRGFERNLTVPFDFICLVDQNYYFEENIIAERFKRSVDQYGWMSLMEVYRPELCEGIRFTVGLDTIITGRLDDILTSTFLKLAVCTDPFHPKKICNAVTLSTPEFCEEFWGLWEGNEVKLIPQSILHQWGQAPSEMVLLRKYYGNSPCIDKVFPNRIISYKVNCDDNNILQQEVIDQASIVYFHGHPKPHQIIHERWVQENWK